MQKSVSLIRVWWTKLLRDGNSHLLEVSDNLLLKIEQKSKASPVYSLIRKIQILPTISPEIYRWAMSLGNLNPNGTI